MIILALVTLILGLFVIRPLLSRSPIEPSPNLLTSPNQQSGDQLVLDRGQEGAGIDRIQEVERTTDERSPLAQSSDDLSDRPMVGSMVTDPVQRLHTMIGDRQEETVEILRSWLEENEENA